MMPKVRQMNTLQGYLWALEGRFGSYRLGSYAFPGCSGSGFLCLCAVDSCGWTILCFGHCPVHCRKFSSILGLYPLGANSSLPTSVTMKSVCRHCWMSSEGQNCPSWELLHQWVECSPPMMAILTAHRVLSAGRKFPRGRLPIPKARGSLLSVACRFHGSLMVYSAFQLLFHWIHRQTWEFTFVQV